MEKTLSILLLLIPFFCISQTKKPIDGFFGIKFGTDSATVKAAILAKGGVINEGAKPGSLNFDVPSFETWKNVILYVGFTENKAYNIMIGIIEKDENQILQDYNKVVSETNIIYGDGKQKSNETIWIDKDNNNISVSTLGSRIIAITYENAALKSINVRNR